jgi:hypothetical protein
MTRGWLRPTRVLVATAVSVLVATSGAVASQHIGPTVNVTNDLVPHPAQQQRVVVTGFSRDFSGITELTLPNGQSFNFRGRPLRRLDVDIIRSDREGAFQAHLWEFLLAPGALHYDFTISQLEARRVPAGVRVESEVRSCWTRDRPVNRCPLPR